MGRSALHCCIDWDVDDILPAVDHGSLGQSQKEELELMGFESEKLFRKWFDCPPPKLDPLSGGIVNGSLVDQCWGQGEDKVQLVLGCHVGCSSLSLLGTLLRFCTDIKATVAEKTLLVPFISAVYIVYMKSYCI